MLGEQIREDRGEAPPIASLWAIRIQLAKGVPPAAAAGRHAAARPFRDRSGDCGSQRLTTRICKLASQAGPQENTTWSSPYRCQQPVSQEDIAAYALSCDLCWQTIGFTEKLRVIVISIPDWV
jgi:hypothetical protein